MRIVSQFGLLSGLATTSSFLIPATALGVILKTGLDTKISTPIVIAFAAIIRFLGEWLFWSQIFPKEVGSVKTADNLRSLSKKILISHPDTIKSLSDMFMDFAADIGLIFMSLKAGVSPAWIIFTFLACQTLAAPIQGIVADRFDKTKYRLFSMIITVLALVMSMRISDAPTQDSYAYLLGLTNFSLSIQLLIVLCAKALLAGTSVISKTTIATRIQMELEKA